MALPLIPESHLTSQQCCANLLDQRNDVVKGKQRPLIVCEVSGCDGWLLMRLQVIVVLMRGCVSAPKRGF